MSPRVPGTRRGQGPPPERPLGAGIVALLRRALHEEEYAAAEHLLQALEELEKGSDNRGRGRRSRNVDVAYLEIARTLGTNPPIGLRKKRDVEATPEDRPNEQ